MGTAVVEITGLSKNTGPFLHSINSLVGRSRPDSRLHWLNGAGKTTTIKILVGLTAPRHCHGPGIDCVTQRR